MESERQDSCSNNSDADRAVEGWTKDEKYDLLLGLKTFGSYDIEKISSAIPNKTTEQIKNAIDYYKKKALNCPVTDMVKTKKEKNLIKSTTTIPLAGWAKLLTDSLQFKDLHTETATALRMIADFEHIPSASCTESIDFRKIYHNLANALDGKALPEDNLIKIILEKCAVETALTSKSFMRTSAYKNIVHTITVSDSENNVFPRSLENQELSTLRFLASQRSYNPLNIPENFLKPSFHNTI